MSNLESQKATVLLVEPGKYSKIVEIEANPIGLWKAISGEFDISYPFGNDLCIVCRADNTNLKPNRALRELDKREEMTYREMTAKFREQESKGNNKHLEGQIVFTADSFTQPYSEASRTYWVSSNNKAFIPGMGGYSIYGSSLDGSDLCVRLEAYMYSEHGGEDGWKVERCYMVEPGKEILQVINGPFLICDGSDQRIKSLSEIDRYMLQGQYHKPERIQEVDGKVHTETYRPTNNHER